MQEKRAQKDSVKVVILVDPGGDPTSPLYQDGSALGILSLGVAHKILILCIL